ncbi:hypothetical protein [Microbacterium lacusdiani]
MTDRYLWWQNTLSEKFLFEQSGAFVFFIDDAELRRIAPDLEDPAPDLALAVRDSSSLTRGAYFGRVERERRLWERGDRATPPPVLPVLALTVLAATRMRSDEKARSTNYYLRLAQSLDPTAGPNEVMALRDEVRSAFQDVVSMWVSLDEWVISQGGRVGASTIRTHERLTRIGYPQSQALLTRNDRAELTRLFTAMGLESNSLPDEKTMLGALEVWTSRKQNRLGETFMAALEDDQRRGLIAAVVLAFGAAWDGYVITRDGRRRIAIRLGIDLEAWTTEWLFPVQDEVGSPILLDGLTSADPQVSLSQEPPYQYYVAEHAPAVTPELIHQGFRLRGSQFAAEFPRTDVLIFLRDAQTGAWSSTAGITPFETHVIAASAAESSAVSRVLKRAGGDDWTVRRQSANPLLPGFTIFEGVRFTDDKALQAALSEEPNLRVLGVAPTLVPRARFVRGLPIDRDLAANHYLLGGEPDVLMPTPEKPDWAVLSLNGVEELIMANGFPFQLRRFPFPEGNVDVVAGGQSLRFTLRAESALASAPHGTGAAGWSGDGTLSVDAATIRIRGGIVDAVIDAPFVLCRRDREETWLLLEGGQAHRCIQPGPPTFASEAGFPYTPAYFEVPLRPSAQWIAQRAGEVWHLARLTPGTPREVRASFDVLGTWARTADATGAAYWALQLGLANE